MMENAIMVLTLTIAIALMATGEATVKIAAAKLVSAAYTHFNFQSCK